MISCPSTVMRDWSSGVRVPPSKTRREFGASVAVSAVLAPVGDAETADGWRDPQLLVDLSGCGGGRCLAGFDEAAGEVEERLVGRLDEQDPAVQVDEQDPGSDSGPDERLLGPSHRFGPFAASSASSMRLVSMDVVLPGM